MKNSLLILILLTSFSSYEQVLIFDGEQLHYFENSTDKSPALSNAIEDCQCDIEVNGSLKRGDVLTPKIHQNKYLNVKIDGYWYTLLKDGSYPFEYGSSKPNYFFKKDGYIRLVETTELTGTFVRQWGYGVFNGEDEIIDTYHYFFDAYNGSFMLQEIDGEYGGEVNLYTYDLSSPKNRQKLNALPYESCGIYGYEDSFDKKGRIIISDSTSLFGVIDHQGKTVVKPQFEWMNSRGERFNTARNSEGLYGALDADFKTIVPFEWQFLEHNFYELEQSFAKKHNQWMLVNSDLEPLNDNRYDSFKKEFISFEDSLGNYIEKDFYRIKKEGKMGLYDLDSDQFLVPTEYDTLTVSWPTIIGVQANNIDVFSFQFEKIASIQKSDLGMKANDKFPIILDQSQNTDGHSEVLFLQKSAEGKKGIINQDGEAILPAIYDQIEYLRYAVFVQKYGQCGLFSKKGEVLVPIEYDSSCKLQHDYQLEDESFTIVFIKNNFLYQYDQNGELLNTEKWKPLSDPEMQLSKKK